MAEVVRLWDHGEGDRYYAKLGADFDPATDEVIVVKKDAARVWIEGYTNSEVLHGEQPEWDVSTWYSARYGYCERVVNKSKVVGVANHDCVEFVAVKTHRPPVAPEVAEAVPVDIDEQHKSAVRAVYPNAKIEPTRNANTCYVSDGLAGRQLSSHEPAPFMAWRAAATRLRDAKPEATALPEPVPELSDEAKVKAVYPGAIYWSQTHCIRHHLDYLSCGFPVEADAWADAARRLNAMTKPVDHHHLGCGVEVVSGAVLAN